VVSLSNHDGTGFIRSPAVIEASPFRKGRLRGIFPRVILNEVKNLGGGVWAFRQPLVVNFPAARGEPVEP